MTSQRHKKIFGPNGMRLYVIAAILGIALCGIGIVHGYWCDAPAIATKYGAVAVALTFAMLFFSRGTAVKSLEVPISFSVHPMPVETRLASALETLGGKRYAESVAVHELVECLVELDTRRERALVNEDKAEAERLRGLIDGAVDGLAGSKRLAVETMFEAKKALNSARQNREGLVSHLDSTRRESIPIAILSVVATLCAGLGDLAVIGLQKLF